MDFDLGFVAEGRSWHAMEEYKKETVDGVLRDLCTTTRNCVKHLVFNELESARVVLVATVSMHVVLTPVVDLIIVENISIRMEVIFTPFPY